MANVTEILTPRSSQFLQGYISPRPSTPKPHPTTIQSIYEVLSPKPEGFVKEKRTFLKGGDICVWKEVKKHKRPRRLLLFNDTILIVKDSKTFLKDRKYQLKTYISIQPSLKAISTETSNEPFEFSIIAVQKPFIFIANNDEEKQEWMIEIRSAISLCTAMGLYERKSKEKEWKTISSGFFGKVFDTLEFEFAKPTTQTASTKNPPPTMTKRLSLPSLHTSETIVAGMVTSESMQMIDTDRELSMGPELQHSADSYLNNLGAELVIKTTQGYSAPLSISKTIEIESPNGSVTSEISESLVDGETRPRSNSNKLAPVRQESLRVMLANRQSKEQLSSTKILQKQLSINEEELMRENRELKKENTRWRMEYGLLFKELDAVNRKNGKGYSQGGGKFKLNHEICTKETLDEFLATFFVYYPQVRDSKVLVDHEGNQIKVKQQFARDVPCMMRLNGSVVEGSTDFDKVKTTMVEIERSEQALIEKGIDLKGVILRELIPELANQTLCLILFEKLLAYYQPKEMMIKQDWLHYIDITLQPRQIVVYAMAVFQIINLEDDTFPPMFVKSMGEIDLLERKVRFDFSAPVFDASQLVY